MANLRLSQIRAADSTNIQAKFTENLDPAINVGNVTVESLSDAVPNAKVLKVTVINTVLLVKTSPLTPFAPYKVTFKSTNAIKFKSRNGSYLLEDSVTNSPTILGPANPDNPIKNFLVNYQHNNVYNITPGTLVDNVLDSQAEVLARALYDIRQAKNDNYLSFKVENELKERGAGPYDRLNEEGAYEVLRVSKFLPDTSFNTSLNYTSFPSGPVTLRTVPVVSEKIVAGSGPKTFDQLVITVGNKFVTKLNKLSVAYQDGTSASYSIESYGYQIKDSRYDENFGTSYLLLQDNQIKITENAIEDGFRPPAPGDFVFVDYEYDYKGRFVDEGSVVVSQVLDATREVAPPSITQFTLLNSPIVSSNDIIMSSNGVTFLDPNAYPPFSETHPAFKKELPFKLDGLPTQPGEYSINYETGQVFVYGESTNDGTGDFPPVCTYKYRKVFTPNLDYTYDSDFHELVANPTRSLIGEKAKISFNYEEILVPGVDYEPQVHVEVLDERINNKLISLNCLTTENFPITAVFRIYNETSGEVYRLDRFSNNRIYFNYTVPPRIEQVTRETVSYTSVFNETLLVNLETVNTSGVRIFKLMLNNGNISSSTEDTLGSSFNSTVNFSKNDLFATELYYDGQTGTLSQNLDRLSEGKYLVDYVNGIVYIGVSNAQDYDLGTVNYKHGIIQPKNPHVTSVSDLYYSLSNNSTVVNKVDFIDFDENRVVPSKLFLSDERFLNEDTSLPYLVSSNKISVSYEVKEVRGIYDHYDITHNDRPVNFASNYTVSANTIYLDVTATEKVETLLTLSGDKVTATFLSPGIEISDVVSAVRVSDGEDLWATPGTISGYDINFSSPVSAGEEILVTYKLKLNGAATPIVDYSRGDYFIDYDYLADEILVSYEYGDNCLDFRNNDTINQGQQYYVTYKVGALRGALLENFGSLVNIPIMQNFDTSLERERYRDALKGALQSFPKGPTIPAVKQIVSSITHVEPELIESIYQAWSLGVSNLYQKEIEVTGSPQFVSGKFDSGILISNEGETIKLPVSSNLRLEEGTLETWVIPEWDGLDNDATLTFSLKRDGYFIDSQSIWIGSDSHHPEYNLDNEFSVNRNDIPSPVGLPSAIFTQVGVFIFYDKDDKRWKVYAKDLLSESHHYSGTITSSGEVYDVKFIPGLGEINDVVRSGKKKIEFEFYLDAEDEANPDGYVDGYTLDGYVPGDGYVAGYSYDGIRFMADDEHYLFDFGKSESTNRFSIYKDGRGYLKFRVYDKGRGKERSLYEVTTDISSWKAGEKHHVAASWRLNSKDHRDEMHLFIDGSEVPNIIRWGGRPISSSTDRFRTVVPEIVVGTIPKKAIAGNDLSTEASSNIVTSATVNFQNEGIAAGDTITILESGFTTYGILAVSNNSLTLDGNAPATLSDARFSVNQYSVVVSSEIDLYTNIAVSVVSGSTETELPGLRAAIPSYSFSKNAFNQNVLTILGSANAGDTIVVRTLGINYRRYRDRQYIWGNTSNVIRTQLPPPINLDEAKITAVLLPYTVVGPDNSTVSAGQFVAALSATQPSSELEGRTLSVRVSAGNVDFSTPVVVKINGTTDSGVIFEDLSFSSHGTQQTSNKFKTISSVDVTVTPITTAKNSVGIEIKESYPITYPDGNNSYPVTRFSYKTQTGLNLSGTSGSGTLQDLDGFFAESNVGQSLVIKTPLAAAGTYKILTREDNNTITVTPTLPVTFTGGTYDVYNIALSRSGFQNGFFYLEEAGSTNKPYKLKEGIYEFDYASYLEIPFDPVNSLDAFIGSDFNGKKQAKAVLDEFRILNQKITDVRVGETLAENQKSVTTDYTAIRPFKPDYSTLTLIHFDNSIKNEAEFWVNSEKSYLQSSSSVNSNFGSSIVITDTPLVLDNSGILSTASEGSIEFWVSPRYDTYNDPNERYYFDASGSTVEEVVSLTSGTVKVSSKIGQVLSVRLATDKHSSGEEYYSGGSIAADGKTINLKKPLPYQKTPVRIDYIPAGLSGDRISIYKDRAGFITMKVKAAGEEFEVRQPVFWQRDTWHRVMATYKFNRTDNKDEIRLFVDGEERGLIVFGDGSFFGDGVVFGEGFAGVSNTVLNGDMNFKDPINQVYLGSDYTRSRTAQARIDNLRLSNKARSPLAIAGQPRDINYSKNIDIVYPVVEDVFTTYLFNFDLIAKKADDFSLLLNEQYGIFNFTLNILDSFGIVLSNEKVKQILETLIKTLKPAQSRVTINYKK